MAAAAPAPALAGVTQAVPFTTWDQPGTAGLDGVGGWVHVAPSPVVGPGQPGAGYVFGQQFTFTGGGSGQIGLWSDSGNGRMAGLEITGGQSVDIQLDWLPSRYYFLLVHHLGGGAWGGWVFDGGADPERLAEGSWLFLGQVQAPVGSGLLQPTTTTAAGGASAGPLAACADFPRYDVWFSPPTGFRAGQETSPMVADTSATAGPCATLGTMESGWAHHRLGSVAVTSFQTMPIPEWQLSGSGPVDAVGGWVHVAALPAAGPGQVDGSAYVYGLNLALAGGGGMLAGLSVGPNGPIAGLRLGGGAQAPVTSAYPWQAGRFYYLYVTHQGGGRWALSVYDHTAGSWTFVAQVQGPAGATSIEGDVHSNITGAQGGPIPPFSLDGVPAVEGGCAAFPRADAWFSPVTAYRAGVASSSTLRSILVGIPACPVTAVVQNGWAHLVLGTPAA